MKNPKQTSLPLPGVPPSGASEPGAGERAGGKSWLDEVAGAWSRCMGGVFPGGVAARAFRPLYRDGWPEDFLAAFEAYLRRHSGDKAAFVNLTAFAASWPQWVPAREATAKAFRKQAERRVEPEAKPMTVADYNLVLEMLHREKAKVSRQLRTVDGRPMIDALIEWYEQNRQRAVEGKPPLGDRPKPAGLGFAQAVRRMA